MNKLLDRASTVYRTFQCKSVIGKGFITSAKKKAEENKSEMILEETLYTELNKSGKQPPAEAEQPQMKGFYADIDHVTPNLDQ
ncbi:hypothetical protein LOD99_10830 [Oopsacas minuta]|uniref:Uncharacterized protein n=1 Tax=Oopsacas minuta TaxID=111878 RepID=A0AAV7KGC7_9METZ|nr:hypothetical protein LOD99_10830 [Oopsacas minuta]